MVNRPNPGALVACSALVSVGVALAGYFISQTLYNSKVGINTAEAKGLAERRVSADRANWQIGFSVSGASRDEIPSLYAKAEEHQASIIRVLEEEGLSQEEISIGVLEYGYQEYRDDQQQLVDQRHTLSGNISVETRKIALIRTARAKLNRLLAEGINLQNRPPAYRFTGLNEIKPDMLREATRNARIAASEFAENAGVHVGGIRDARQGNFFVRDAGEEYGDTAKIEKDVRVVTTITFYLTD